MTEAGDGLLSFDFQAGEYSFRLKLEEDSKVFYIVWAVQLASALLSRLGNLIAWAKTEGYDENKVY